MTNKKRIGVTDYVSPPFDIEEEVLGAGYELVRLNWDESMHEFKDNTETLSSLSGLLVWHAEIDQKVIPSLSNCKIISRYGVGYDNLDVTNILENNIKICNTPDYGTEEVADTNAAMIIALQRKVFLYDIKARQISEGWQEHVLPPISRTRNQTLGVIGIGRIGTALINRMKAFGFNIIGYDPYQARGHEKAIGYERCETLDELLAIADIVSINCVLTHETQNLVDADFIKKMKKGAMLVNTARGGLIKDLDEVIDAILSQHLSAAALDVLPQEPPIKTAKYIKWHEMHDELLGRLIINPHSAYYSDESWDDMRRIAATNIKLFFEKGILRSEVTS